MTRAESIIKMMYVFVFASLTGLFSASVLDILGRDGQILTGGGFRNPVGWQSRKISQTIGDQRLMS
jgi:hypothetical protein